MAEAVAEEPVVEPATFFLHLMVAVVVAVAEPVAMVVVSINIFATTSLAITGSLLTNGSGTWGNWGNNGKNGIRSPNDECSGGNGGAGGTASTVPGKINGCGNGGAGVGPDGLFWPSKLNGGGGGYGGSGAGGGIALSCTAPGGMNLNRATLDALAGGRQIGNAGTVKVFYSGFISKDEAHISSGRFYILDQDPDMIAPVYAGAKGRYFCLTHPRLP